MKVHEMRELVQEHLAEIQTYFKPGAKLTFVARHTALKNADVVITTEDDLELVVSVIRKLEKKSK